MLLLAGWTARIALAGAFLSVVADRFGVWGLVGTANVSWSNVTTFDACLASLNGLMPSKLISVVRWSFTTAELLLALALLTGWRLRWAALVSAILLLAFAVGMKTPLNYSSFAAASAAFLLFAIQPTNGVSCTPLGRARGSVNSPAAEVDDC